MISHFYDVFNIGYRTNLTKQQVFMICTSSLNEKSISADVDRPERISLSQMGAIVFRHSERTVVQ